MKNDFLFEALDNISDKHIEEAATYKSNVKAFPKKKAVRIAACFAIILVCAVGAKLISDNVISKPPVAESTGITTQGAITGVPTIAGITEASAASTTFNIPTHTGTAAPSEPEDTNACPPPPYLFNSYPVLNFDGKTYRGRAIIQQNPKIKIKLGETKIKSDNESVPDTTAEIFEYSKIDKDCAVAVRIKNDFDDNYFYTYVNYDFTPETLGEFIEKTDAYLSGGYDGYYLVTIDNYGEHEQRKSVSCGFLEEFHAFVSENSNALCRIASCAKCKNEMINFKATIMGIEMSCYISDHGFLYVDYYTGCLAFEIGEEKCRDLINCLKENSWDYETGITCG